MKNVLEKKIEQLLENSANEIIDEFKNYVIRFVYENHKKPTVYENPNGREFLDNWEWSKIKKVGLEMSKEMFFNWKNISNDPDRFGLYGIHGSMITGWDRDARRFMPEILDKKISSSARISVIRPQTYWKMFIRDMFQGGQLKKIIDKNARKLGLQPE